VCALRAGNSETAILRSYDNNEPELLYNECKIWEACRATSAATTFFDPIKIGPFDQEFADGGVIYNNPVQLVNREAAATWPDRIQGAVLISVGTGSAPGAAFQGNLKKIVEAMKSVVTQTERTANDFFLSQEAMVKDGRLFRFNVLQGLANVGLEEYKEKAKIADSTQTYLMNGETKQKLRLCVEKLSKITTNSTANSIDTSSKSSEPSRLGLANFRLPFCRSMLTTSIRVWRSTASPGERQVRSIDVILYYMLICKGFYESLDWQARNHRYDDIEEPFKSTYSWIFEEPGKEFLVWLKSAQNIFWISGKAGSGKSTMMKYIFDDPKTLKFLNHAPNSDIKTIGFFFHNRGSALDASFEGLLRHLLREVLTAYPQLALVYRETTRIRQIGPAAEFLETRHQPLELELGIWPLSTLQLVVYAVVTQQTVFGDICLFVDGLDEFEGDDQTIANFFRMVVHTGVDKGGGLRISACLSSRPHIAFQDAFRAYPRMLMHEKTHADISKYVTTRIKESTRIERPVLFATNPSIINDLLEEVIKRAMGVFLWVRLAVNALLQGLSAGDSFEQLNAQLLELPDDLEGLYKQMLRRIEPRYRQDTALLLQLIQTSRNVLSYGVFITAARPYSKILTMEENSSLSSAELELDQSPDAEAMKRRMLSRCGGLLEISSVVQVQTNVKVQRVQFIHQTVKEFLQKDDTWQELFGVTPLDGLIEAHRHHAATFYYLIKSWDSEESLRDGVFQLLFADLVYHIGQVESLSCQSTVEILDLTNKEITRQLGESSHWYTRLVPPHVGDWNDDLLSFAIHSDLELYIENKIKRNVSLVLNRKGRPLLHYAVDKTSYVEYRDDGKLTCINVSTVASLLGFGADPNQVYEGASAWQLLLGVIVKDPNLDYPYGSSRARFQAVVGAAQEMLLHGADVHADMGNLDPNRRLTWVSPVQLFLVKWSRFAEDQVREVVRLMVRKGADLNLRDNRNVPIVDYAKGDLDFHAELVQLQDMQVRNLSRPLSPFPSTSSSVSSRRLRMGLALRRRSLPWSSFLKIHREEPRRSSGS
jgi:hypothetical protein